MQRVELQRGTGQIAGPHGSGKTTLLTEIRRALESRAERPVRFARLSANNRCLPWRLREFLFLPTATQILIDGFEQLPVFVRWYISTVARIRSLRLLVTCHFDCGLPTILQTRMTLDIARRVVDQCLRNDSTRFRVADSDLQAKLERHHGNLREVLFDLYDTYQALNSHDDSEKP